MAGTLSESVSPLMTVGEKKRMRTNEKGANEEEKASDGILGESVEAAHSSNTDDIDQGNGESREQKAEKTPKAPTREEYEAHRLAHYPYRSWCPHCVASRRPNSHHRRAHPRSARSVPRFCADDAFVKDSQDDALVTILASKLHPSQSVFASVVDSKGSDAYAISRLTTFFR